MQTATPADREALTRLLFSLRPDWDEWLIKDVLTAHPSIALPDLVIASVRWAADPNSRTPKGIGWTGRHWSDLATRPESSARDRGPRCTVCGKPEGRCLTERPGPDDHTFEPVR